MVRQRASLLLRFDAWLEQAEGWATSGVLVRSMTRLIERMAVGRRTWTVGLVLAGLCGAWLLAWGSGSPTAVSRHWFYVPVVIAAVRLGPVLTSVVAVAAGLLAGPLVPLPELGIGLEGHGAWAQRMGFFIGIGLLLSTLVTAYRRYQLQRERVMRRERDLAVQRAAVTQTISHELRTPLTIIKGSVETWERLEEQLQPASAASLLPSMRKATLRLERLVLTVLAAAGAEGDDELTPVRVGVAELLDTATRRARPVTDRSRIELATHGAPEVTTVPDYVTTALTLLLDNAIKFSPADEAVTVTARCTDELLEIEIRDRGPGVDAAEVEWLFEPITQVDQSRTREHGGLGIGLHTSRRLARRLGGDVDLAPHPLGGSVARLVVPNDRR